MDRLFDQAVDQQNFSAIIKLLDVAVDMFDSAAQPQQELNQLLLNRGYCNQRLGLYRKALKVRARGLRRFAPAPLPQRSEPSRSIRRVLSVAGL
jgi:hypothetical protein